MESGPNGPEKCEWHSEPMEPGSILKGPHPQNPQLLQNCEGDTVMKPLLTRIKLYRKMELTRYRHTGALIQQSSSVYIANNARYMSRLYLMQQLSSEIKLRFAYCVR